jgi:hypothetical protein
VQLCKFVYVGTGSEAPAPGRKYRYRVKSTDFTRKPIQTGSHVTEPECLVFVLVRLVLGCLELAMG